MTERQFTSEEYDCAGIMLRGSHSPFNTGPDGKSISVTFTDWKQLERYADMLTQAAETLRRVALAQAQTWQPIATHDKSSTPILVSLIRDGKLWRASDAYFNGLGYYTINGGEQCHWRTHWMPLPPPSEAR